MDDSLGIPSSLPSPRIPSFHAMFNPISAQRSNLDFQDPKITTGRPRFYPIGRESIEDFEIVHSPFSLPVANFGLGMSNLQHLRRLFFDLRSQSLGNVGPPLEEGND